MSMDRPDAHELCAAVAQRIERNEPDLTARIRAELPSYTRLSESEHRRTVHELARRLLTGIADREGPVAEHLQYTRRAALRRMQLGVSAYDMMRSFHIVSSGIWNALQTAPEANDALLLDLVEPLATWTEALTAAVVDAFIEEQPVRSVHEMKTRREFFAELGDRSRAERTAETARTLAFDVDGEFQALCSPRSVWPDTEVEMLQRTTRHLPGVVQCGVWGNVLVALVQDCDVENVLRSAQAISGASAEYGVGLARRGLAGAHQSCIDAERALRMARVQKLPVARFVDWWLEASLLDFQSQLAVLFDAVHETATKYPDLAEAVLVFADCGFSLARAARRLQVHPNSVAYRLTRWQQLSGADPRTFDGLARSVIACRLTCPL